MRFNLLELNQRLKRSVICTIPLLVLLFGCVGTVEDKNPLVTKAATANGEIVYEGAYDALGVAMDRVEIYFQPFENENENIVYDISYDNVNKSISVPPNSLSMVYYKGLNVYRYTIKNLIPAKNYTISVNVRDIKTGAQSLSKKIINAQTFSNVTADFDGVASVSNVPGELSNSALKVSWVPATKFALLGFASRDVTSYLIELIDTPDLEDFDDPAIVRSFTALPSADSFVVKGLVEFTQYRVRVRAIHSEWNLSESNIKPYEQNNKILTARTGSSCPSVVSESFLAYQGGYISSKRLIALSWQPPTGNFDEYEVTYEVNGVPKGPFIIDSSLVSYQIGPFADGDVVSEIALLAKVNGGGCQAAYTERTETVSFELASFPGVKQVAIPNGATNFQRLQMDLHEIDFSNGFAESIEVKYCTTDNVISPEEDCVDYVDYIDISNDIETYDIVLDSSLILNNVNIDKKRICFQVAIKVGSKVGAPRFFCTSKSDIVAAVMPRFNFGESNISCQYKRVLDGADVAISPGSLVLSWQKPSVISFDNYLLVYTNYNIGASLVEYENNVHSLNIEELLELYKQNTTFIQGVDDVGDPVDYNINWTLIDSNQSSLVYQFPFSYGFSIYGYAYLNPQYILIPMKKVGAEIFVAKGMEQSQLCTNIENVNAGKWPWM